MFPSKFFNIDPKTKSVIGEVARLRAVAGHGGVFEHMGDENFGLKMITNNGVVSWWSISDRIEAGDRLTFILKSLKNPDHKMVLLEKIHAC